jgi:hypothetical protein
VSLSTNAAGATGVNYTIGFTTSATGALSSTGTITFATSGATVFPGNCSYTITDVTTSQSTSACPAGGAGSSVTLTTGIAINSGDKVQVAAVQVANSHSTGSQTLTVSTSSDLASTTSFSLVAASPVTGVSVSLSTKAEGATGVDYTMGFTTSSSTGALDASNGTITLSTSGSTVFASNCSYTITDVTTSQSASTCPTGSVSSSVTISAGITINHGDSVTIVAAQVANAPSTGSQTLTVSTSSDHAATAAFSLVAASPVTGVSVSLSTKAAGATEVDYTMGFTTSSSTGALDANYGTITLSTSGSTLFPSNCSYTITDVSTSQSTTTCPNGTVGSSVTITPGGLNIRAGDSVTIVAAQVANAPSTGSQTLTVSTSSDHSSTAAFSLVAASAVTGVSVSLSTGAAGAKQVDYTVGFTTSSSTGALDASYGTITLSTSGATLFPSNCSYTITDVSTSQSTTTCPNGTVGSSVTVTPAGLNIRAGDTVTVVAAQVANAPSTGSQTLTVSTSSDLASSTGFSLVAASHVTAVSVKLSVTRHSALSKYTVGFTTSPTTGALDPNNGTIKMVGPGGTAFPSTCTYLVTDVTTSTSSTACPTLQTNGVVITNPGLNIRAGDKVSVVVASVKNGKATGAHTLSVSTSSDLAGKGKFTLT